MIMSYFHAHNKLLEDYIFKGYTFGKMELDPLDAPGDEKYGIPPLWSILLGETIQQQEKILVKMGIDPEKMEEVQMSFEETK